jgi:uncharacterized RDD family membrane protein YckC
MNLGRLNEIAGSYAASVTGRALFVRRTAARLVDSLLLTMLTSAVLGFFVEDREGGRVLDPPTAIVVLTIVGVFLYECLSLRALGATPGKLLLRLRVRRVDGGDIESRNAIVRAFIPAALIAACVSLPAVRGVMPAVVAALFASAFAARSGRGIVDVAAGTEVVPA